MVTVTATDPSGLSATINVTIKVTNENEAPELTGMDSVRVPENTAVSTAVETYMATDDEDDKAGTAITWSLSGTDAADFTSLPACSPSSSLPTTKPQRMRAPTTYTT